MSNIKGNHKTETFTDEQIIKGLLERMVPANEAEKEHLEKGSERLLNMINKAKNWDKVKSKLTAKQVLHVLEGEE